MSVSPAFSGVLHRLLLHVDNCYHWPALRVKGFICKTNLPSNTAFRGFGGPQGMQITEHILDHVAHRIGVHVNVIRELNMYHDGDVTHFNQPLQPFLARECWSKMKQLSLLATKQQQVEKFNRENRFVKRGIACVPTKFGVAFGALFLNQGGALVHVYRYVPTYLGSWLVAVLFFLCIFQLIKNPRIGYKIDSI
jgi:xanthine dehydrogenase/oxidase